jgi:hypothetical protein
MAVQRQQNWLGQQRVDVQHARAIESGVAYDFDVVGQLMTKRVPSVISGFTLVRTGAIGNDAEKLVLQVAGSMCLHFNATEAGSFFRVEDGRADEVLKPTNPRVKGSFTPGAINYVGIDLVRTADDGTADDVQFLVPTTNVERAKRVPLARSMNYRVVVSTNDFSSTPGVCPLALVTTDASNRVTVLADARWLMFRLGAGGSTPSAVSPFAWPGGRNESDADPAVASIAGDRSIKSLKEWMAAAMTRIWEVGGGEFWYSLTADRNVKVSSATTFVTTQEPYEWVSSNLHWQALKLSFDNSNGVTNTIAAQTADSPGLTDLADGECVYVDLDRTQTTTVAPHKAVLHTLGGSARPGQRWVLAWRVGSKIFVRDQQLAVGLTFAPASTTVRGVVKLTADSLNAGEIANPRVANVVDCTNVSGSQYFATVEGISHNADKTNNPLWAGSPNQIQIGRGTAAGDGQILLKTDGGYGTVVVAAVPWSSVLGALQVDNQDTTNPVRPDNKTLVLSGDDGSTTHVDAHYFEVGGAIGFRNVPQTPETPNPGAPRHRIRSKLFFTTNGLPSPDTKDQFCVMWWNGLVEVIKESPAY